MHEVSLILLLEVSINISKNVKKKKKKRSLYVPKVAKYFFRIYQK